MSNIIIWGLTGLKHLFRKEHRQTEKEIPEMALWFVKNGKLSPYQGKLLIFAIIGIQFTFSILLSYILQNKLNTFTIMLFSILLIFRIFFGIKEIYRWFPIYLFLGIYDLIGIFQRIIHISHFVKIFYYFDLYCFGWLFGNEPPSFYFYEYHIVFLDIFFGIFYTIHIIFPPIIITYLRVKHEEKFDRMAWSATFLIIFCLGFFIFMPTAPPWYVYYYGFSTKGITKITMKQAIAGVWFTGKSLHTNVFGLVMWSLTSAKFSAFPSMHVATPSYIYFSTKRAKINWMSKISLLYVIIVFIAIIYLNHHWVADALGGLFLAWLSTWLSFKLYGDNYDIGGTYNI